LETADIDRRTTQSNRLLQAADKPISLRQGVMMNISLMTTAAKRLYMHHYFLLRPWHVDEVTKHHVEMFQDES